MKYTAEYLLDHNVYTAKVTYRNGDYDLFEDVYRGVADYILALEDERVGYSVNRNYDVLTPEECSVLVYPRYADDSLREDMTLCDVETFLEILNSGNKVEFNVSNPF